MRGVFKRSKELLEQSDVLVSKTMKGKSKYYYEFDRNMTPEQSKNLIIPELRYFKFSEFDSPDKKGSGKESMDRYFLSLIDDARHEAGIPFKITSGFRTAEHNIALEQKGYKVARNSAHLKGLAVDIAAPDSKTRYKIIKALTGQKISRIGIGKNFVHCDIDNTKTPELIWTYY